MSGFARCSFHYFGTKFIKDCITKSLTRNFKWDQRILFHRSPLLNVVGQEIKMPSLSPTMTEGKIIKWLKQEGDSVKPGDLLCEIQTDKAIMAFETEEEGVLAKILVKADTDVKVGKLIAVMVAEGEDWKDVEIPSNGVATPEVQSNKKTQPIIVVESTETFTGTKVSMPSLSPTMTEGTIIKWLKVEGDKVAPGDALCEIQTDKAVMVFETEEEGILAKILVPNNTPEVKVGDLIALIVEEGEDWKNVPIPKLRTTAEPKPTIEISQPQKPVKEGKQKFWPAVRFLIEQYQLDPNILKASGPKGRLIKKDVLNYISENRLSPKLYTPASMRVDSIQQTESVPSGESISIKPELGYTDVEISNMRRTIAKRLTHSKVEIPHAYCIIEAEIDDLIKSRKELKSGGINISLNDFVVKAVAAALKECPFANSLYLNDQIQLSPSIDVSIAVATPSGLITPIIKFADTKSVIQISEETKDLAERARANKLQLHEFQGGSFTISNLGMFGIREFTAIINPPQCGILAVGSGRQLLVGKGKIVTKMACTLSFDERALDQLGAAEFLSCVQYYLESPALLLSSQNRKSSIPSVEERYASSL